ncbi:MAG: MucR family transcriptional regulator [Pseudomonadota bacterium]|nr:MucR family transcriptional regulator [Pseudomonadota bacterium]
MNEVSKESVSHEELLEMTVEVVSSYVGNNTISATQIPDLINIVFGSLTTLKTSDLKISTDPPKPSISIRRSIKPDYLICLEDGKKLKMLKRHLRASYGMTPDEYRSKWGLSPDYPMVAPNYAEQRSSFAKQIGLGRKKGEKLKRKS